MATTESEIGIGRIVLSGEIDSALPLEHTEVTAQLSGPVASVTVVQRFGNPLSATAELEYLFPLAEGAALTGFSLRLGSREIRGEIEEIQKARENFAEARSQGRRAGLLEQRRPNLFAVQITNVLPGETILAEIRYHERVKFSEDGYEFVFPMGLTPKYDRQGHADEGIGVHAPVARPGEAIGLVDITVAIDSGLPCGDPTSPSHPLDIRRMDERRLQVRLAGEHIPNRDFVLRLPVAGDVPAAAGWSSPAKDGAYFLAAVVPPRAESEPLAIAREFVFVLDRSGSMGGEPILQARNALRACLRTLNSGDTFHILLFDDRLEWYRNEPSLVTQAEVDRADAFLNQVDARGGTEIIAALEAALALPVDAERTRFVVFLTDGAVSAEAAALEALRRKMGRSRIFTFGIGPSVNRALLARMARQGSGASEFLQADEDIEGAVIRFQDRVSFPVLTDLNVSWEGAKAWDVYPARLPDLYIGQALELCGRYIAEGAGARLIVRGKRAGEVFESVIPLQTSAQADPALARVWARARVDELLETMELEPRNADALRAAVIGLALEHRLVTPFTAFAALDAAVVDGEGKPLRLRVAQPLPQGLDFNVIQPQMINAMSAMPSPAASAPRASTPRVSAPRGAGLIRAKMARRAPSDAGEPDAFMLWDDTAQASVQPGAGRLAEQKAELTRIASGEEFLREMARTQNLDGSWGGDVEYTAAALLAFVRQGHTTTAGSFRQAVRRAAAWLAKQSGAGFAGLARARALRELAEATGDAKIWAAAQDAEASAGTPATALEKAAANGTPPPGLTRAEDLDALRLAGFYGLRVETAPEAMVQPLARAWAALIK